MEFKDMPLTQGMLERRDAEIEERRAIERSGSVLPFLTSALLDSTEDFTLAPGVTTEVKLEKSLSVDSEWIKRGVEHAWLKVESLAVGSVRGEPPHLSSAPLILSFIFEGGGRHGCTEQRIATLSVASPTEPDFGMTPVDTAQSFSQEEREFLVACIEEGFETKF